MALRVALVKVENSSATAVITMNSTKIKASALKSMLSMGTAWA